MTRRNNLRRLMTGLVLAALSGILLSGCSSGSSKSEAPTLRLGYRPKALADTTPVIIEEAQIARPGVRVELVALSSPSDALQKFAAGEVDAVAGIPLEAVFQQLVGGGPGREFQAYYLQVDAHGEGWVSLVANKGSGVSTIADLAGKTVASLPTTQAQYLLRRILIAGGVPPDQVRIVTYNPATPLLGLRSGEHAAIFGLEPAVSMAISEGHEILAKGPVSHYLYKDQPVPVSASLVSAEFVNAHPHGFADFVQMVEQATEIARSDPNRVRAFFGKAKYGGLTPEVRDRLYMPVMAKPTPALRAITQQFVEDLVRDKQLKGKVDLAPLFPTEK